MQVNAGGNILLYHNGALKFATTATGIDVSGKATLTSGELTFSGSISDPNGAAYIWRPADNTLAFGTANEERMRIDANGKIFMNEGVPLAWTDSSLNVSADIYGDSSDNLVFRNTSAKTERMRINSLGNVGIGTSSPQSKLETSLHSGATSSLMDANTTNDVHLIRAGFGSSAGTTSNSGAKWGIRFVGRNDANYDSQKSGAIYGVSEDTLGYNRQVGLAFHTSALDAVNTERMRIDASGNVGIGTDDPDYPLHIKGTGHQRLKIEKTDAGGDADISIAGPSDSIGWLLFTDRTAGNNSGVIKYVHSTNKMHFRTNDVDDRLVISDNGNVGIGTDSPGAKLSVSGPAALANLGGGSTGSAALYVNSTSGHVGEMIQVLRNGAIKMYMANDGDLALGHSSPSDKLDIQGADNGLTIRSISANRPKITLINGSSTMLTLSANGTYAAIGDGTDANRYMSFKSGNVGIGNTDPTATLHVQGKINAQSLELGVQSSNNTFGAQSGYLGDFWEAGLKAVYYLGYLGSSPSAAGTANWFNFYTSGHWGQFTRVMVYSINHYPSPGYSKWDVNGTTVTQLEGRGSVGSVSVSQSTVTSNGHAGQPVYKYTVTLTMPGTYTQGPWFVALQGGGGGGHLSASRTDAEADAWFTTRGGGMHLRNISAASMDKSPMYVTGT